MKLKVKGVKESFEIAGASVGFGLMGDAFNSEGLKQAGTASAGFVPIAVIMGMGATLINMVKKLKKKEK